MSVLWKSGSRVNVLHIVPVHMINCYVTVDPVGVSSCLHKKFPVETLTGPFVLGYTHYSRHVLDLVVTCERYFILKWTTSQETSL
jgi:hypothetical protein